MIVPCGGLLGDVRAPAPTMSIVLVTAGKELIPAGCLRVQRTEPVAADTA